ncbi:LuxR C-terminal-related transcriptional regulator [Sphingobium sp. AS12]|uniref:response regulator transcription factor n=1 Tax=Sphingobium sp. AS12 TaxID=2849495 RepID=UPI001C31424E|nr:LuxR C-terminal-related transcriptional regulator [Sphingobium sp. AS12]MBV2149811.1 LuxR C-terminal-related transcriptional regulator [Sphingobium sp. AS12]
MALIQSEHPSTTARTDVSIGLARKSIDARIGPIGDGVAVALINFNAIESSHLRTSLANDVTLIDQIGRPDVPDVLLYRHRVWQKFDPLVKEAQSRGQRVIILTDAPSVAFAVSAVRAGAWDLLPVDSPPFALRRAIMEAVEAGIPPPETGKLPNEPTDFSPEDFSRRASSLSPREREVLASVVAGKPTKVIAYELGISVKTVDIHRTNIKRKFGTATLTSLLRNIFLLGGLPPIRPVSNLASR